jgi:MraZ protein
MSYFFSGAHEGKLDEKNRVVLPHDLRYGLVENGVLQFSLALGMGGCLSIYRKSDIDRLVEQFQKLQYVAKYQKFLTIFFSTLFQTECDKVGRITLPPLLKKAAGIDQEVVIAGVLNKIEVWPKEVYMQTLSNFFEGEEPTLNFGKLAEEAMEQTETNEINLPMIGKVNVL